VPFESAVSSLPAREVLANLWPQSMERRSWEYFALSSPAIALKRGMEEAQFTSARTYKKA
jgi:hypothetical protein